MYDNKVRLSYDVLEKAERIAAEWGLKNARAAVEAVFRRYCDEYLYGRPTGSGCSATPSPQADVSPAGSPLVQPRLAGAIAPEGRFPSIASPTARSIQCEALEALDQLLAL